MPSDETYVRPTKRCLEDLSLPIPNLGVYLHEIEHPLVVRAQQVPDRMAAGAAERIRSLTDRTWFKVKTSSWRGAAGELDQLVTGIPQTWWIAAAGPRVDDSPQHDFYAQISTQAHAAGSNSCSTDFLLPTNWDHDRLQAEAAVKAARIIQALVRRAAGESLLDSDVRGFDVGDRNVRVRIRMLGDGEAYIAIGSTGSVESTFITTLLSSIPGLPGSDWMPEPTEVPGLEPAVGEILWSAMIPPDVQQSLMDDAQREW